MANKVNSFRAETTKLTCDVPTVRNVSLRWVVQFVGSPGLKFNGVEHHNVHYVCPYRKYPFGWAVDPWHEKLLVKEFDFERGVVIADGISKDIEFYVDEKEYN